MRPLLTILLAATLAGCGGDGGGGATVAPPVAISKQVHFGYFGTVNSQIAETATHADTLLEGAWGDTTTVTGRADINARIVSNLKTGKGLGYTTAIVALDHIVYNPLLSTPAAFDELQQLFKLLRDEGVIDMVVAFYPIDEPDGRGLTDNQVEAANLGVRAAARGFPELAGVKLAVIYGVRGRPGFADYDWIGFDDYGKGAGALAHYNGLGAGQQWILVPGGADPWRNDPEPFVAFSQANPVAAVIGFVWFDGGEWEGGNQKGIRSNGQAARYCAAGQRLTGRTGPCPL